MSTINTLKKLQKEHSICGKEENFTIHCFRYGNIVAEYRNEIEREVCFNLGVAMASIVIKRGITISTSLTIKK